MPTEYDDTQARSCLGETVVRVEMTWTEYRKREAELRKIGVLKPDGKGVLIRLPKVNTEGERALHIQRLNFIRDEIDNARDKEARRLAMVERQQMEREARANLRRFAT
jgi:hypothetical protein